MSDVFDLSETDDLPFKVKVELSVKDMLLDLLGMANRPLSITELRVGLWRQYSKDVPGNQISSRLCVLIKEGLVKRSAARRFELSKRTPSPSV